MENKGLLYISLFLIGLVGIVNSACAGAWGQCGGNNFNGDKCCVGGYTCNAINQWYSQCVPGKAPTNPVKTTVKKTTTQEAVAPKPTTNVPTYNGAGPKTIFIAGDSTADNNGANNGKTAGWGKYLGNYVTAKVNNQAKSGQSARTFWRDGRWKNLIAGVGKGDYVLIEFGHNDVGGPNTKAEKGSAGGTGNETVTVTRSNGQKEVVHTFPWYIRQMANQVIAKGATPVLLSNTPNFSFNNGKVAAASRFQGYMKLVANELKVPFIDHYNYIARQYEKLGEAYLRNNKWYPTDNKHTSPASADFNAKMIINAAKCQKINPLVAVLNDNGKKVNYSCSV